MAERQKKCRSSLRGTIFRELIAAGVKATGSDILTFTKKNVKIKTKSNWRLPLGWKFEKVSLPHGANAVYLVPKNCFREDIAILHLHGGGYTLGYFPLFKHFAVKLAKLGGVPVLSLDYRIAPEHHYPAALDDAMQAIEWLKRRGISFESILAIGESCGAGLALALAMRLRDNGKGTLKALVLMSPWADLTCGGDSYANRYHLDPMFGRKMPIPADNQRTTNGQVYAGGHDLTDPYLSPAFGDFSSLPPMLIHIGEYEMLYDDAAIVYKKAVEAGIKAELKIWPGMFHAFQLADWLIPEARKAWREVGIFIRQYLYKNS